MDVCLWENKNFDSNKAWLSRQKMKRIELRSWEDENWSRFNSPRSYLAGETKDINDPVLLFHRDSMLLTEQVPTILFRLEGPRGCLWPLRLVESLG